VLHFDILETLALERDSCNDFNGKLISFTSCDDGIGPTVEMQPDAIYHEKKTIIGFDHRGTW